jgi:hypothetical protein
MEQHTHIERLTEDRLVHTGPCVLYVCNATIRAAQQLIEIYDGIDIVSGMLIERIEAPVLITLPLLFLPGAEFTRGLFVHIGTRGDYCTIVWGTLHEAH